jgi:hypothetical protein
MLNTEAGEVAVPHLSLCFGDVVTTRHCHCKLEVPSAGSRILLEELTGRQLANIFITR